MKKIKVLGTGCATCKATEALIKREAAALGVSIELEKVEDLATIMGYGVMSTPAVVVDGQVVHVGGLPSKKDVHRLLSCNYSGRL